MTARIGGSEPPRHGWAPAEPLRRPVLFVNPRSGGGKAGRTGLVDRARDREVETIVLGRDATLEALVADAVARGADGLGMAGGDGSLAVVAAAARAHALPFVCIPAARATTSRSTSAWTGAICWARSTHSPMESSAGSTLRT